MEAQQAYRRGLSQAAAHRYLGVSAREFRKNWKPHLAFIETGTRTVFDRIEIDALFESRLKRVVPSQSGDKQQEQMKANLDATLRACRNAGRQKFSQDDLLGAAR